MNPKPKPGRLLRCCNGCGVPTEGHYCKTCVSKGKDIEQRDKPKPGRQLKACGKCGAPTERNERGWYCKPCQPAGKNPWKDPEYLVNRKTVLAEEKECWLCGEPFTADNPATVDHVVEVSAGGGHERSNLRAAHRSCNSRRGQGYQEGMRIGRRKAD